MGQRRLQRKYCAIRFSSKIAELSQEELTATLRSIFEAEGLNDQNVIISINDGIFIEEATAAPAAALAAAPENVPSHQNQPPDKSSDEEDPKELIGMGHASDSGEDLPEWDRS